MKMMGGIEMNKMPGFTAEAALHSTSGYYRTSRNGTNNLATRMMGAIQPAEVINVHGCSPGHTLVNYDDGSWECFPDPLTEGGGSSTGGGWPSGGVGGGGGGGSGGGGTHRPRRPPVSGRPPSHQRSQWPIKGTAKEPTVEGMGQLCRQMAGVINDAFWEAMFCENKDDFECAKGWRDTALELLARGRDNKNCTFTQADDA